MKVIVEHEITDERLNDLLFGHFLAYSPWIEKISGDMDYDDGLTVTYDDPNDGSEEGDFTGRKNITREDIKAGLQLMATNSPDHFSDFLRENDDAITADLAWQYVVLGEVVYG